PAPAALPATAARRTPTPTRRNSSASFAARDPLALTGNAAASSAAGCRWRGACSSRLSASLSNPTYESRKRDSQLLHHSPDSLHSLAQSAPSLFQSTPPARPARPTLQPHAPASTPLRCRHQRRSAAAALPDIPDPTARKRRRLSARPTVPPPDPKTAPSA